jgi:hypothetical protein
MATTPTTPRKPTPRRGGADTAPKGEQERMPRLPHEHDESADSQQPADTSGHEIGKRAFDDLQAGRVDTDRGPVMDGVYRRTVRKAGTQTRKPRR